MKHVLPLLSLMLLTACGGGGGGSASSTPAVVPVTSTQNLSGSYSGTLSDNRAGRGTTTLTISQSGNSISGTFSDAFSNASLDNSGGLSGSVNGSSVQITLTPSNPNVCPYTFTGTVSGTTISGTYAAVNCSISEGGSLSVTQT